MTRNLHIIAPVDGPTGYDELSRGLLYEFYLHGVDLLLTKITGWSNYEYLPLVEQMLTIIKLSESNKTPIHERLFICLPEQTQPSSLAINMLYTMFEASGIPDSWVPFLKSIDRVFVPSQHSYEIFSEKIKRPGAVSILPCGYDAYYYHPDTPPLHTVITMNRTLEEYRHRILVVGENTERKNLEAAVTAFLMAFHGREDVCMIIKTSHYSRRGLLSLERIAEIRKSFGDKPPIFIYPALLRDDLMASFMAMGTCYFSTSRGEGYDLSCVKMMAMNKPVVVPWHTSYKDYVLDMVDGVTYASSLAPCVLRGSVARLYEGLSWFEPDIEEAAQALLNVTNNEYHGVSSNIFSFQSLVERVLNENLFW